MTLTLKKVKTACLLAVIMFTTTILPAKLYFTLLNQNYENTLLLQEKEMNFYHEHEIRKFAEIFQIDLYLAEKIWKYSIVEDVDPYLTAALIESESSFNPKAVSIKGYMGLMQIPYHVPYEEANIVIGIKILKEKIRIAEKRFSKKISSLKDISALSPEERRVLIEAIRLYKGYTKKHHLRRGHLKARKTVITAIVRKNQTNSSENLVKSVGKYLGLSHTKEI